MIVNRDLAFPNGTQSLHDLWNWIIRVPQTNPQQKQIAQFAAGTTAMMGVVASLIGLAAILIPNLALSFPAFFAGAGLAFIAHALNRRGRYSASAWIALGSFNVLSYGNLITGEKDIAILVLTAAIAAVSTLYVGTFFPGKRWGLPFGGLLVILYLILPIFRPGFSFKETTVAAAGIAILGLLYMVYENHRATLANDPHAQLEATNSVPSAPKTEVQTARADLEQELKDLRIELQATVDEYERVYLEAEKAREEAERSDAVKSAFLASMSHELRTPLNAIINLTKFVASGDMGPINESQEHTLNDVVDSGKHLLALINDVLDMSKIESGSLNLFIEDDVNLEGILTKVCSTGKILLDKKPVDLVADIADNLPPLSADRQRIFQALLNIMSNACKFTDQGSILLKAYQTGDDVIISVQDTGPGIAPENQPLVFEAFKQTTTGLRQTGGTGLGMPISKNLIEAHSGRLWLESELDKGSTFFVSLPVES